ncbi:DUF3139 domain-containing protein [Enterococcus faecalis]|nr:DUF3139 domain-containing protein [Enterococcus faecalis]EIP8069461.1 DUF3139 domain-containing protein [Enterococcus faecalis]
MKNLFVGMEKKKKKRILLVLFVLLLLVLSGVVFSVFWKPANVVVDEVVDGKYVEDMTSEELQKYLQEKADKNYVHLQVSPTMSFNDGSEVGNVTIKNSPQNAYSVRMIAYINNKKEKIYDSGLIPPSSFVNKGKLLKDLKKGTYDVDCVVKYYDKSKKVVGQSNVVGTLIVNN